MKNIPSRDDINTAVSRFLEKGGQIERLGSVKPGYVTEMWMSMDGTTNPPISPTRN